MKTIIKMNCIKSVALILGLTLLFLFSNTEGHQVLCLIVGGICVLIAILAELLTFLREIRDSKQSDSLRLLEVLCLILFLISISFGTVLQAVHCLKAENNISYVAKKDYAIVWQVSGGDAVIKLADYYGDKPVTVIGKGAFGGRDKMTEVMLPSTLKEIRKAAFRGCSSLSEITFPDGFEAIGEMAFMRCKNLKHIIIPVSVTKIDRHAFLGCSKDLVIVGQPGSAAEVFVAKAGLNFEAASS